jgi:hypothetical protein
MDYICEYKNSIPNILCNEIIQLFESEKNGKNEIMITDVNTTFENKINFIIPKNNEKWKRIELFLYKEMLSKLNQYINKYTISVNYKKNFENNELYTPNFIIQKYGKQESEYQDNDYHDIENSNFRLITFIWHLNSVDEGGDTIFWENYKVRSEQGKLLLFPCTWCYPYVSQIPISSYKYVITGWIYEKKD